MGNGGLRGKYHRETVLATRMVNAFIEETIFFKLQIPIMHNKTSFSSFDERKLQEKKEYEKIVDFFLNNGFEVEDVSEEREYFNKDIDLFIIKDDIKLSVEVKMDEWIHKTNNFFFEIISNEERSTPGCFLLSEANILVYYDTNNTILYIMPLQKVKKRFFNVRQAFKEKKEIDTYFPLQSTHTTKKNGEEYQHTTIGRLIKKKYIIEGLKKYSIDIGIYKQEEKIDIHNLLHMI